MVGDRGFNVVVCVHGFGSGREGSAVGVDVGQEMTSAICECCFCNLYLWW